MVPGFWDVHSLDVDLFGIFDDVLVGLGMMCGRAVMIFT
jgi:hypothetical protein